MQATLRRDLEAASRCDDKVAATGPVPRALKIFHALEACPPAYKAF